MSYRKRFQDRDEVGLVSRNTSPTGRRRLDLFFFDHAIFLFEGIQHVEANCELPRRAVACIGSILETQ